MIALLLVSLFVAVLVPAVALALFLCKRKGAARRFAVESVVVACIVAAILFLGPRSAYDVGRDTVHAFGPGKPNLPLGLRGKGGGGARVTAGPKRPHLSVGPSGLRWVWRNGRGPHLEGRQAPQASSAFRTPTAGSLRSWALPGSSVHGILQARILEWAAVPFSRASSQPRD